MYGDSSEEEQVQEEPLPPFSIRSSDMSEHLQQKCVRSMRPLLFIKLL